MHMHPKYLSIKDFIYDLPEDRIAKYPLAERDASKLLIYKNGKITEDIYRNLDQHLPAGSLLVFNDTRVIEARLLFKKPTGGVIEIFCLEPHARYVDITTAMMQQGTVLWQCLIGGASKWKHGQVLEKHLRNNSTEITLRARYIEKQQDSFMIELSWEPGSLIFAEILHHAGVIPLPPYVKREPERSDAERYQTIFAHYEGSVAAPTAGLHFTENILENLKRKNIQTEFVTLHVGAGTFKPVKSKTMEGHEMHSEFISVSEETIENILKNLEHNIIPVGTTSLRTIESLYWLGLKVNMAGRAGTDLHLSQWEPYDLAKNEPDRIEPREALQSLLAFMKKKEIKKLITRTQILIAPGYTPKIAKVLVTNFHQPQSTLLLLVAAFIGKDWKKVYDHALKNNFRFLSYGDGCLLWAKR